MNRQRPLGKHIKKKQKNSLANLQVAEMRQGKNGSGQRKLHSWIARFIEATTNIESPALFRKWTAISTIAAVLEQKVWIKTSSAMYPNLFTFLVAPPGGGKSRAIDLAHDLIHALPDPYIAPTSINAASIIDHLLECKRVIINLPEAPIEYHSMSILVGEFGTFMSSYDDDLMAILTDFYNVRPYGQRRRGGQLKIKIERPSLNLLIGTTPSNLMKFMPENAWGQGFASRILFIYSEEKEIVDDFAHEKTEVPPDLIHDLGIINTLVGQFAVTAEYRNAVNAWRELGENLPPKPTHPRLQHYNSRRKEHLYRLSMVSAIDRGNALLLTKDDFNRAMSWLIEAEQQMPRIFSGNSETTDSTVMNEAIHMIGTRGGVVEEGQLVRFVRQRVPSHSVMRVIEVMEKSRMIVVANKDRFGVRTFGLGNFDTEGSA